MPREYQTIETRARALLAPFGLSIVGWFDVDPEHSALLVGNRGPAMWAQFSTASEYCDGEPDPLNRWTERVLSQIAEDLEAKPQFPFGEIVWPFQQWTRQATHMQASPIGLLIDPDYGLWHAFRAALVFDHVVERPPIEPRVHPCDRCAQKPCLTSCPVSAFDGRGFDVVACRDYLQGSQGVACLSNGCRAREACPVGSEHQYSAEQIAFHMRAFIPQK